MIELKGKYNSCKVFTDLIDASAISQLTLLMNQEFCKNSQIRIMPDVHAGAGCTIGTTMTIHDKIVPNLVGVDIGCSVTCIQIQETAFDPQKLDNVIRSCIPSGHDIHDNENRTYTDIENLRCKNHVDLSRAYRSIGTLGGGNHYIEVDTDDEGYIYLCIHSGSRHLGLEVAKYYQDLAYNNCNGASNDDIKQLIAKYKAAGRQREIQQALITLKNTKRTSIPKDLCYLTGSDMDDYIHDMRIMNGFAKANHAKMADIIISNMGWHIAEQFTTTHNYIDTEHMILRKGSVSARKGEKLIIPMNMRDGSLICIGKGNDDWNQSAPHGAGRLMSRGEARANVDMGEYKDAMKDIWTTSVCEATIDESPMAYKPMESIIENVKDTVDIIKIIKPVYNFKASE